MATNNSFNCEKDWSLESAWHGDTMFGLNDFEAIMNVDFEAKEWIVANPKAMSGLPRTLSLLGF